MKSKYLIGALAIAAASFSLPAAAQMSMPSLSSAYIGGSIGQSDADYDCEGATCDTKDSAWRIFGGYQVNRHFSAELGYANLGEATFDFGGGDTIEAEANAFDISVVGAFPVGPVSLYGRVGLYRADVEVREALFGNTEESSNGLLWGVGVQYDVNKNLGVRAEWQQYNGMEVGGGEDVDVNVLSVGVLWRFQ